MRNPGDMIDIRFYGTQDQVASIIGKVIMWTEAGVMIETAGHNRTEQFFPWTSVQRIIQDVPKIN